MLSLRRLLATPPKFMSAVAAINRRNLVLTSKACQEDVPDNRPAALRPADLLKKSISTSQTVEQLQSVVDQHLHVMNTRHLLDCMFQFKRLVKSGELDSPVCDNPSFKRLAGSVLLNMRFFDSTSCVLLARVAGDLKLDCSMSLVQGICQMLRKRLNELGIQQIMSLRKSLRVLSGSSVLTETLSLSLPIVFESQVDKQLDPSEKDMCIESVKFVLATGANQQCQDIVADRAQRHMMSCTPDHAAQILYSAAFSDPRCPSPISGKMLDILRECLEIISGHLDKFDSKSVRRIMSAYSGMKVYSEALDETLWNMASSWNLEEISRVVQLSVKNDSFSMRHLVLLKDLLHIHKNELESITHYSTLDYAHLMAMLAIQSPNTDRKLVEIGHALATHLNPTNEIIKLPRSLSRFLLYLAILEVYPRRELDWLFSEESQKSFLSQSFGSVERLLHLEQWLRVHLEESEHYRVMPELKNYYKQIRTETILHEDLVQSLQVALGGASFLLERVETPLGAVADLAVVMRQGEYPIALSDKASPLEDLPKDCKVVAILQASQPRDYNRRGNVKRIPIAWKERLMRAQNICPVIVNINIWNGLPHIEKIPYIMRSIKDGLREGQSYPRRHVEESL